MSETLPPEEVEIPEVAPMTDPIPVPVSETEAEDDGEE